MYQKGTKRKCENYREITLLPTAYKLFAYNTKQTKLTSGGRNGRRRVWL
jgi:hypothetical protein